MCRGADAPACPDTRRSALRGVAPVAEHDGPASPLARDTCERMVEEVEASWDLDSVTTADTGFNDVYFLTVETPAGARECVLKVSDDTAEQVRAEARLCGLLDDATDVPVPTVHGRVDAHSDLPSPYFLMERLEGDHPEGPPGERSLPALESLARQLGRHLGDTHAVDAFDAFGWIRARRDVDGTGAGSRPIARRYGLTVAGATDSWPSHLRDLAEMHLEHHPETRFGDRTSEIRAAIEDGIDRLDCDPRPVVGRVDHAFENVLVDDDGDVTGVLDWGMLRTVAPAYDLACAEMSLTGTASFTAERRECLRTALLDGYERRATVDATDGERRLYCLVNLVARQNWVSAWIPGEAAAGVERDHRALLDELLAG